MTGGVISGSMALEIGIPKQREVQVHSMAQKKGLRGL